MLNQNNFGISEVEEEDIFEAAHFQVKTDENASEVEDENASEVEDDQTSSENETTLFVKGVTAAYWHDYKFAICKSAIGMNSDGDKEYYNKNAITDKGWLWSDEESDSTKMWADGDYITQTPPVCLNYGSIVLNGGVVETNVKEDRKSPTFEYSGTLFKKQKDNIDPNKIYNEIDNEYKNRELLKGASFIFDADITVDSSGILEPTEDGTIVAYYNGGGGNQS